MSLLPLKHHPLLPRTVTPFSTHAVVAKKLAALAKPDAFDAPKAAPAGPVQSVTDAKDWHLPSLDEVFELARRYPGKPIFLDVKLPADNPEVAKRLAGQVMELLRRYPDMKDRVIIGQPNRANLDAIKAAFAESPDFKSFKNFTFDHEELNVVGTGDAPFDAHPLHGSGDNKYVSIGDPKTPGSKGDWNDLLRMAEDTLKQASDPNSPHHGKKLICWTVNDEAKIRQLAKLGVHAIMTDNPDLTNKVLDEMYAKDDPKRPQVMCHRGGPDDGFAPENTMPMIERGFQKGDSIEIDIVSCTDGVALFHDNDAGDLVGTMRNLGFESGNFRPTNPGVLSSLRGKEAHELSMAELRKGYGYERTWPEPPFQSSKSPFIRGVGKVFGAIHVGALAAVRFLGALGLGVLEGLKSIGKGIGKLFEPIGRAVRSVGNALENAGKAIGGFFKKLFGKKKKKKKKAPSRPPSPPPGVRAQARRPTEGAVGVTAQRRR